MMILNPLAKNCHILQTEDKEVLFSYETPIAFRNRTTLEVGVIPNLSSTTNKHVNTWLGKTSHPETTQEAIETFLVGSSPKPGKKKVKPSDPTFENDLSTNP